MSNILVIFLTIAIVKCLVFGGILYAVFKEDIKQWVRNKQRKPVLAERLSCPFCGSKWTKEVSHEEPRWDKGDLVLVINYECEHCHFPILSVERLPVDQAIR